MLRFAGSSSIVHIPSLLRQLGNEKVVLQKLPPKAIPKKEILHYFDYNYSTAKENNNNNNCDGSFQEPEKKIPMKLNKDYCSRCKETVDTEKLKEKFCPKCDKMLSYKCGNCDLQFTLYCSLLYHLENACGPPHKVIYINNDVEVKYASPNVNLASSSTKKKDTVNIQSKSPTTVEKMDILDNDYSKMKETNNNNNSDDYFFQKPEKKIPMKLNKDYCTRCKETVDTEKLKEKFCPKCGKMLSYRCEKCDLQFTLHCSLLYHLENACGPPCKVMNDDIVVTKEDSPVIPIGPMTVDDKIKIKRNKSLEKSISKSDNLKKNENCSDVDMNIDLSTDNDSQIEESNLSTSLKDSLELNESNDLLNSSTAMYKDVKYQVIPLQKKSSALRKLCVPCKNKVFDLDAKNCTECKQRLPIQCVKCGKLFSNLKNTNIHLEKCYPLAKFRCLNCKLYETTSRRILREHIKIRCKVLMTNNEGDTKKTKVCKICKQIFVGNKSFVHHKRFCGLLRCTICPYKTPFKNALTIHMKSHPKVGKVKNGRLSCWAPATYRIKNNPDLISHIKEHCLKCRYEQDFDFKAKRVDCPKCKYPLKWKCIPCDKFYGSTIGMFHHQKLKHVEDQPMNCHKCYKEFRNYLKLNLHKKYCFSQTYKCNYCDFKDPQARKVKIHHSEEHPNLPLDSKISRA